ncbi:hypothetical protein VP511E551_P0027 [Vibrio phage 511E55-1]|nr:hypothetical protein VP511E551_P0027 [Vibrio phage 511E55-1]
MQFDWVCNNKTPISNIEGLLSQVKRGDCARLLLERST